MYKHLVVMTDGQEGYIYVSHTMVQHRKLRDKSTHLWSLIYDKEGKNIHGEKTISSISGAGITG